MKADKSNSDDGKNDAAAIDLREIRELARRFSPDQIENCIRQQMEAGTNVCLKNEATEVVIGELAKAEFVRDLMDKGLSQNDAFRELARRIRQITRMKEVM
jgi:hypothetical protein